MSARYVALGSSFAAGLGLGPRAPRSPCLCMRSRNGYPQLLARLAGYELVDRTCSGATAAQVLRGGQFFQASQLDAITPETELVTLTAGGNDIGYVGDLTLMAMRRGARGRLQGMLAGLLWKGARPVEARDFATLGEAMEAILAEARRRAPRSRIVVVTYPAILPPCGPLVQAGITEPDAQLMRAVGERLADVTRDAARDAGALLADMASFSAGHDCCSPEPWVHGARPAKGAPFHPTLAGANATARAIMEVLHGADASDR